MMKYKLLFFGLLLLTSQVDAYDKTNINELKFKPKAIALIDKNRKFIYTKTSKLMRFDAKDSYDPDGNDQKLKYEWRNGDKNTISQSRSFIHKYDKKGIYEATLKVTDEQKLSSTDKVCILVDIAKHEIPLKAKAGVEKIGNSKVKLNGRAICRDDIINFEWREGEIILSNQANFEHHFKIGRHILELKIKDRLGNEATDKIVVNII